MWHSQAQDLGIHHARQRRGRNAGEGHWPGPRRAAFTAETGSEDGFRYFVISDANLRTFASCATG